MPGEAECGSVFRLPVHFPVSERNGYQTLAVRRPRVLAGDKAIIKRTLPVVADRRRTGTDLAGTSGAVAACGGESRHGSRAGVANCKLKIPQQKACVLLSSLAFCGYAGSGNMALPRANDRA